MTYLARKSPESADDTPVVRTTAAKATAAQKPAVKKAAVKKPAAKKPAGKTTVAQAMATKKTTLKKAAVRKVAATKLAAHKGTAGKAPLRASRAKTIAGEAAAPAAAAVAAQPKALNQPSKLMQKIQISLEDSKAENIIAIDLAGRTSLADYMVIATGRSTTHVSAIADRIMKMCKDEGFGAPRVEGIPHCDWVLVDALDVIVHIFRPEVREFYNLEKMWSGDRPVDTPPNNIARR